MLAGVERGHRHPGMQMVWHDDVDEVDRPIAQERGKGPVDRDPRKVCGRGTGRCVAAAHHCRERQVRDARNRAGMHATPGAVSDQTNTHWLSGIDQ